MPAKSCRGANPSSPEIARRPHYLGGWPEKYGGVTRPEIAEIAIRRDKLAAVGNARQIHSFCSGAPRWRNAASAEILGGGSAGMKLGACA